MRAWRECADVQRRTFPCGTRGASIVKKKIQPCVEPGGRPAAELIVRHSALPRLLEARKLPLELTPSEASEVSRESFGPPGPPPPPTALPMRKRRPDGDAGRRRRPSRRRQQHYGHYQDDAGARRVAGL